MKSFIKVTALAVSMFAFIGISAAQTTQPGVVKDVISGTMDIQFNTRTNLDQTGDLKADSPALGAKDKYITNITINKFVNFTGEVSRQPNLYSRLVGKKKQDAELYYNLTMNVVNPNDLAQRKAVGKWVGVVPVNTQTGAFDFAAGKNKESPLRFDVDSVGSIRAFKDNFTGFLYGKAEKKESLAAYTMKRILPSGKTVQINIGRSDPMRFENLQLAKGPSENYPRTTVNGTLNYDYETGNYFADGIRFTYVLDGKEITDIVTGSIKWVEDANRVSNGKGRYEFNLRWNEDAQKKSGNETGAFDEMSEEDAFFAVDTSIPTMTGNIEYIDTFAGEDVVASSKVVYHLDSNKLTKQQVMSFAKLWLVAIGPVNDE